MAWSPLGTQSVPGTMYCLRHQMLSLGCNHLTTVATTDPWASLHCPKPTASYFFKTSLWSLDHLLCVACSPQSPITTSPIHWIWKSIVHSVLTTSNGSKSNAHPILTCSNCQSPMLTQFSSPLMVPNAMLTQFSPIWNTQVQHSPNSHLLQLSGVQYSANFHLIRNHPNNSHPILIYAVNTHAIFTS